MRQNAKPFQGEWELRMRSDVQAEEEARKGQLQVGRSKGWKPRLSMMKIRRCGHLLGNTKPAAFNTGAIVFRNR
jgi:hypothetical protein